MTLSPIFELKLKKGYNRFTMFYIKLQGGLGNQLFQYAFGLAASRETGLTFALDISRFGKEGAKYTPRHYQLDNFNVTAPVLPLPESEKFHTLAPRLVRKIKDRLNRQNDHIFNANKLQVKDGQYIEGLWQSDKYFKKHADEIREEFSLKKPYGIEAQAIADQIQKLNSEGIETILVHVRRGDFVTNQASLSLLGILDNEYFSLGIDTIAAKLGSNAPKHIFVATEDPEWVKQNIKFKYDVTVISRPGIQDFEEITLMSLCKHFVISNSTFSWWSAWLSNNPKKMIVAPKIWMRGKPEVETHDLVPAEWIRI